MIRSSIERWGGLIGTEESGEGLRGLDLEYVCQNAENDLIIMEYLEDGKVIPVPAENGEMARVAHEKGNVSLHLNLNSEINDEWPKRIACQLGMNFSAYNRDFSSKSQMTLKFMKAEKAQGLNINKNENFIV